MRKILSTKYSAGAFNFATFILRITVGVLIASHGYDKLVHFSSMKNHFMNFIGLGSTVSLALVVFAEFFCSIFVILGLFTRLVIIPIIIVMCVVVFVATHGQIIGPGEKGAIYLASSLVILLCGPGRISIDGAIGK